VMGWGKEGIRSGWQLREEQMGDGCIDLGSGHDLMSLEAK
jgi:hypothetical protein